MAGTLTGTIAVKRVAELLEKNNPAGYKILIDKLGDADSFSISFEEFIAAIKHNGTGEKQGGTSGEYYHLTAAEVAEIAANTSKVSFPEAPNDGNEYVRKNEDWVVATGGGGTSSRVISYAFGLDFAQNTDVVNASWVLEKVSIPIRNGEKITKVEMIPESVDTGGTKSTLDLKIKGEAGNVLNSALSVATAASADGSGGSVSTDINTSYDTASSDSVILLFYTTGLNADTGAGTINIYVETT